MNTRFFAVVAIFFGLLSFLQAGSGKEAAANERPDTLAASITSGPSMTTPRSGHWMLHDASGDIFVVGGYDTAGAALANLDFWSKSSNTFTAYTLLNQQLFSACARLADGTYLLAGGATSLSMKNTSSNAEIFNPATKSSVATAGTMTYSRANATAATLASGKVLVVGGAGNQNSATYADLYDPVARSFATTGALNIPRCAPLVLPTTDGKAVVIGGFSPFSGPVPEKVELYDPATNTFSILRETLFENESGWITALSPGLGWGNEPVHAQQTANGNYLFLANKNTGIYTDYAVFSFNPGTKAISRVTTSPGFPTRNPVDYRYNTTFLPHPMVNAAANSAYVMAETFDSLYSNSYAYSASSSTSSKIIYYGINLNNNAVTISSEKTLPSSQYVAMSAKILADSNRFFIVGGGPYGYGKYAGGRPYGGYGYQHYNVSAAYAKTTTLFDTIDWHILKGLESILMLLLP